MCFGGRGGIIACLADSCSKQVSVREPSHPNRIGFEATVSQETNSPPKGELFLPGGRGGMTLLSPH